MTLWARLVERLAQWVERRREDRTGELVGPATIARLDTIRRIKG